ncbi:MAG TPA: 50S ribosomal protein L29 [Candidatus Binatia bacterium]|jgi:large subunit ribosomal protein L29|nr:50S ribosomal protein L29 [Candidatus Binatia bacterium]
MKISELREKTDTELDRLLSELRNRVRDLRFKVASRQLNDVREIREARKAVAQILTLKRSRRKEA